MNLETDKRWSELDRAFMKRALELAFSEDTNEVPVGAVLVSEGEIIGEGWNSPISSQDPTAHAEMAAIRSGSKRAGNYRLLRSVLYVTLEPCVMCAGAIVNARIERLVFGARDLRFGGVRSKFRLADSEVLNHRVSVEEGLFAAETADMLRNFFAIRRRSETT